MCGDYFFRKEQSYASAVRSLFACIGCTEKLMEKLRLLFDWHANSRIGNHKCEFIIDLFETHCDCRLWTRVVDSIIDKVHDHLANLCLIKFDNWQGLLWYLHA